MLRNVLLTLIAITFAFVWWKNERDEATAARPSQPGDAPPAAPRSGVAAAKTESREWPVPPARRDGGNVIWSLRPDILWELPVPEPEFAEFKGWAAEFPRGRRSAAEGVHLAQRRRAALVDLISKDPRRALELAAPEFVRRTMPPAVQTELEQRVSGRGDLLVTAAAAMPGRELATTPVARTVVVAGQEYEAFTFGRREPVLSRRGLAIHGIALDGKLALSEWPARVLEPLEAAEARARLKAPPLCPVSGNQPEEQGDEVVLDWGLEQAQWFCQASHATQELLAAAAAEAALPPGIAAGGGGGEDPPGNPATGTKTMLLIRVDFPDKPGQVVSDATLTSLINSMASHWTGMSFGQLNWQRAGEGSAFTPTLRLPLPHARYSTLNTMLPAARAAAEDAGYDWRDYDFEFVITGDKPDVSFGGIAYVGTRGAWLANGQWNPGMCSHEAGHNFGLHHSGFWNTTDGTPHGAGVSLEYGNPFDHMGGASSSTSAHFNVRQKWVLGWIPESAVRRIGGEGGFSERLTAFDREDAGGVRAIAVDRDGTNRDYWIEYRSLYTSNQWLTDGILVNFGDFSLTNAKPSLLDFTRSTSARDDCALLIGRTFSDNAHGIHLTPTARGVDAEGVPCMDVTVNRGTFPGNRRPVVSLAYSTSRPAVHERADFTVTASDPDGDALSCFWDWGDGTFTANNATANSRSWDMAGFKTVRCTVSDMKGLTATASAVIQVGSGDTFFLSGTVRDAAGTALEGVTVSAGTRRDVTDGEGFFAVTGLAAGSYTVTAAKPGLTFYPSGFSNPVVLGPGRPSLNFIAPPGSPAFAPLKPALVNAGSTTGAVPLYPTDPDTPVSALTITAASSNPAVLPDTNIAVDGGDFPTVTVTAPAEASGPVHITLTATDPGGNTGSQVWPVTVNTPPVHMAGGLSTPENTPLDIDLRTLVSDDLTPRDDIAFRVDHVRRGSVRLLPDGYTARFTPAPGFDGTASFRPGSRDRSLSPDTLLLYDFEPDAEGDVISRGIVADRSNFNRPGTLVSESNGEYSAESSVPARLAPHSTVALHLTENGGGGAAKLTCTFDAAELDWNDSDWTFCSWVKRNSNATEDIVFHLGDGDGHGPQDELQLRFAAGSGELRLEKFNAGGLQAALLHPGLSEGAWHHLAVTFDRTSTQRGTLALYVDGFPAGTAPEVAMEVNQLRGAAFGGHAESSEITRWLDGSLDDVVIARGVLTRAKLRTLAAMGAAHAFGLTDEFTVPVVITGANDPPLITPPADTGMNPGTPSPSLTFHVSDAESDARTLTVAGSSSDPALLPPAGIVISAAPPAWQSADIGTAPAPGTTIEDHGTFLITSGGAAIGGATDSFRFVSQTLTGDADLICRVVSLDDTGAGARAGLMFRTGTEEDAPFAMVCLTAGDGVQFSSRSSASPHGETAAALNFVQAPVWLRLVRRGGSITGYYAPDDGAAPGAWIEVADRGGLTWPPAIHAGLAVCSTENTPPATAAVDRAGGSLKSGGDRELVLHPAPGQTGTSTITLRVSDGTAVSTATFLAAVGVNTPPVLPPVPDLTIVSGATPAPFAVTLSDLHTAASALTLTATSSDTVLLPVSRIVISGAGAQRTVQLRPVPGETGTALVTLVVSDGTLSTPVSLNLTVLPGDPALLIHAGTNWRYYDAGNAPSGWNTVTFDDAAWPAGPAELGFGDGDESTLINANSARRTTYFRRRFSLADPALFPWMQLRILRDDGAVIHLNGQEILRTNMPEGLPVTPSTEAILAVEGADENRFHLFTVPRAPLVAGTNILAVEVHQKGTASGDLSFDLEARGTPPVPVEAVPAGAVWRYLDNGQDPGNGWMDLLFADSAWKTGAAQFGYGDGDETTVISAGPEDARFVTAWFRKQFAVDTTGDLAGIGLRVLRDDGIQVWLNGRVLYRNNLPPDATAATLAINPAGPPEEDEWHTVWLPPDLLTTGINQLAAELHQSSVTGSDAGFDLQLLLYSQDSLPPLMAGTAGGSVTLTWPLWAESWRLQSSPDLESWNDELSAPAAGSNAFSLTLPHTGARQYFRLALP